MDITRLNPEESLAEFKIDGTLDTLEVQVFLDFILPQLDSVTGVILECTDLPYMTSTGLRAIMTVGKILHSRKQKLLICGLHGLALKIYVASGFAKVFPVAETLEQARSWGSHEGV